MSDKSTLDTMCCLPKALKGETLEAFRDAVRKPRFYCERCHRVARKKRNLCKPVKIAD